MNSLALNLLADEVIMQDEHQANTQRVMRRKLRDISNPFDVPQVQVNKCAFKYLLNVLMKHTSCAKKKFAIQPIVKLSACLRFLAEGGYQTGVGKDYDIALAQSSLSKILIEVLNTLQTCVCPQWIQFPTAPEEQRKNALAFYEKHKIPGVVGCVDGTHVRIIAPSENKHLYYNRKGFFSLNVMLVCDHELKILYVNASHPGACHDAFVWNVSEVRQYFEDKFAINSGNAWLLGDAGYPLEPWLMTPFRAPEDGSADSKYNEVHSKCRNAIERTNGVLKARWRCILGARELHYTPEKAAKIINVCCCLHNICLYFKVDIPQYHLEDNIPEMEHIGVTSTQHLEAAKTIRCRIRDSLVGM